MTFKCPVFRKECLQYDCKAYLYDKKDGFFDLESKEWITKHSIKKLKLKPKKLQARIIHQIEETHFCKFLNKEIGHDKNRDFIVDI